MNNPREKEEAYMRKISIVCCALLALFMLAIMGCGGDDDDDDAEDVNPPTVKEVIIAGDTTAATNGPIIIVLSEDIDPASVQGSVTLSPVATAIEPGPACSISSLLSACIR